ncbi:BTAD domain-containing putative transcriptional regulator [Nocardia sp. IFM 10818]
MVYVGVLGALRVEVDGRAAALRGPMQGAVLARLVSAGGEVVSADRLVEDLWQGEPPPKAAAALQAHISYLRRALEPARPPRAPARVLISQSPGYALCLPATAVDVWHFEELVAAAAAHPDPRARRRLLGDALTLWRGPAYAPYATAGWAAPELARLTDMRWTAMEQRASAALELGRPDEAATGLHRLVEEHPEREEAVRLLALAHYRAGRQLEALATLRRTRTILTGEFGVDPSPPLRELESAILAHAPNLLPPVLTVHAAAPHGPATPQQSDRHEPGQSPTAGSAAPHEFVVGYLEQRAVVAAAAREATAGRVRLVWVEGEAGAGKSTVARAITEELRVAGWTVAMGHCPEVDGAPVAWAWVQLLGELGGGAGGQAGPFEIARAVTTRCGEVGWPVAMILEDTHRADGATLQILRQVVAWLAESPVLILVTLRGSEAGEEIRATAAALAAVTAARPVLSGLDGEAVRSVAAAAGMRGIDDTTLALLRARTGGNPLFVRELAKLAAAEGNLHALPIAVRDVLGRRIDRLPAGATRMLRLVAVWGDDIDFDLLLDLSGEPEDTLIDWIDTAVVAGLLRLGRTGRISFGHALIRDTVYGSIPALRRARMHWSALETLERTRAPDLDALAHHALAGLGVRIGATAEPAASAALDITDTALSGGTATGSATDPARATAAGVRVVTAPAEGVSADWGFGGSSGMTVRGLGHVVAAARHCEIRGARADAAPLWRAALELYDRVGEDGVDRRGESLRARCGLVTALAYSGNHEAARVMWRRALDWAETLEISVDTAVGVTVEGDTGSRVIGASVPAAAEAVVTVLTCWRAPVIWSTRTRREPDQRMADALADALRGPVRASDRVRLLVAMVFETEGWDDARARDAAGEALGLARTLDDDELLCAALNARAFMALGPDLWDERAPLAEELLRVSEAAGLVEYRAVAHYLRFLIAAGDGDLVGARQQVELALECAIGGQLNQLLGVLHLFSAVLAVLRADYAAAEAIYAEFSAAMVASGSANGAEMLLVSGMVLGWARGDLSGAVEELAQLHAVAPHLISGVYACALLDAGRADRAREVFAEGHQVNRDYYWSALSVFQARAAVALGDVAAARVLYADLLPRSGTMAGSDCGSVVFGPMDAMLAELAEAFGDTVAAAGHRARADRVTAHIEAQLAQLGS